MLVIFVSVRLLVEVVDTSVVRLKGEHTQNYLAMNSEGNLYVSVSIQISSCKTFHGCGSVSARQQSVNQMGGPAFWLAVTSTMTISRK